jgi:DNA-binding MarR family transcriptional regulator
LDRGGPAVPSALARAEQISRQGMGAMLGSLAERGLVEGRPDPQDGRRTLMTLTEAGQQVVRDQRSARTRQLAAILAERFTDAELDILRATSPLLERLGESI